MGTKTFTLRLSEELLKRVSDRAAELNISKNDYIRCLIESDMTDSEHDEVMAALGELKQILLNKDSI